jgi:hypothetical protein
MAIKEDIGITGHQREPALMAADLASVPKS